VALALDGHEVMAILGIGPGPEVGQWLEWLWEAVLDEPAANTREALAARLRAAAADSPGGRPPSAAGETDERELRAETD
jgi:tRNA nucleotidyltransferase (CCA-adding enzyme)